MRTLAAAVVLATGIALTPAPAHAADTNPRNCSVGEYRRVHVGMTRARLIRLMDSPGRLYGVRDDGDVHIRSWLWGRGPHTRWCEVQTIRVGPSKPTVTWKGWVQG